MKKITFDEFKNEMVKFNSQKDKSNSERLIGKIVFKASNWPDDNYTEDELTYITNSDQLGFRFENNNAICADCAIWYMDQGIRLDWYMKPYDPEGWEVDYCEIIGRE